MEQNQRAFLKPGYGAKNKRKNVGLGFKTPKLAKEGKYIDKKCPWRGNVSIRGRLLRGTVLKNKMQRSVVIRRNYMQYRTKYQRFEKRHTNFTVHMSPALEYAIGDEAIVGECRPLSKTIRFNVLKINPKTKQQGGSKQFQKF
eukprot:NODE_8618_length_544_cov_47.050360_g8595_i0.p1 GENE.NODE_8618_length_544_cov_47.050360_g8595_i0~~NODE_8618_length_544_cov_47.050360_g8595_i0.p1  ORF type:complete len:143 (-),score=28.73 NODE_8618_length_544_cov_47.050360_g8595_i0:56-484(-)